MKMIVQKIIALTAILIGMTGWSGDSAPFLLDTIEPLVEPGEEVLFTYNSTWIGGDSSAEVVISANGTEIKRATGEGNFTWGPATPGKHTLTYTTYIDGVLQEEVYTASVFKDWKYTVENDKATIIETTQTSGNVTIPSEIDGYPVVGVNESIFEDCTSVTIHVSVSLNNTIDLKHCKNLESITMEYAGVDGNTPTKVYLDDELLLSSAEYGTYTWVPYSAGVHELRCETGSKVLTILVNIVLSPYVDSPILPNPPGTKDETLSLSLERKEFTSAKRSAGTFSVASTTGSGTWSASASDEWISLTKTSGSVSDKVSYIVEANTSAQARVGYVYVSGHVHTIVQPGTGVTVTPSSLNVGHQGVMQSIAVDTLVDGASWVARPEYDWISLSPVSGSGDGNVNIQVAPYYIVGTREGTATIAGETVTIFQRGRDMELTNYSTNITSSAQSVLVDVSAISDVTWSIVSGADWITVSHPGSGLGSSTVDLTIAENTSFLPRTATVAIGTEVFTITQYGATSLIFSISESDVSVPTTETSAKTLEITATPDLPWKITSNCNWLAPLNNYKTGDGTKTVAYSIAANPTLAPRSGKLTFTPDASSGLQAKTLTVTQAAAVSSIDSASASLTAAATTVSVEVTVDPVVNWSVSSSVGWVTIDGSSSRTGASTVELRVSENTSLSARNGTVTIAGHTYTIRQAGGKVGISSSSGSVVSSGGTLYINVTGSENLNWSIQNAVDWVTIEGDVSHTGPTTLVIRVDANTGTEDRKCEIIIGGEKLTIEQAAAGTIVEEDVLIYGEDVDIGSFSVEAPDYLIWETFTENDDWIIVTSDSPTTGSGDVEYIVDGVDSGISRIGILWVGNTPVYICQSSFSAELSETSKEVSRLSGNGQIAFEVGEGNKWSAVSTVPWIRLANSEGEGDGFVSFEYDENTTEGERVGRIIIVDKVFTITQSDVDPSVPRWSISYENLKGASNPNPSRYDEGSEVAFLPLTGVIGYTFTGWTPSSISASDTGNKIVRANWVANNYTLKFDANGGFGEMPDQLMTYGTVTAIADNTFTRLGYQFAGWKLDLSGDVVFADRALVMNLSSIPDGVVRLYAAWTPVAYNISYEDTKGAMNSNPLNYTIEDAVTFSPLANVPGYVFIRWVPESISLGTTGDIAVTALWRRDWNFDDLVDSGLAQITNGGSANWYKESNVTYNGGDVWRSGIISDSQSSWMEIEIENATEFSFSWKVSSESNYDKLSWSLDGVQQAQISGSTQWVEIGREISPGKHKIRFEYSKDSSVSSNDDCGYISGLTVVYPETVSVTFDLCGNGTRLGGGELEQEIEFGTAPVLPTVSPNAGWRFLGWFTAEEGGDEVTSETVVSADMTIYAHWERSLIAVDEPVAVENLVYNGLEQMGVIEADGYTLSGVIAAVDAGEYTAIATLVDGYKWDDGSMGDKTITWSITKATNEWITEPNISLKSWIKGETAGELIDGVVKFGEVIATINGVAFTALPTEPGSYTIEYSVAETGNYSGLTKSVTFEIIKYVPIIISEITYENLRGATHANPETYQEGTVVEFTNPSEVEGYTFAGWTPERISADMTGAQTVRANWTANNYTIAYNANGGNGMMEPTLAMYDSAAIVKDNEFVRDGYTFKGWALEESGDVVYVPGQSVMNLTAQADDVITFYAVWERILIAVDEPVAVDNLIYNASEQIGIAEAEGYTLSGVTAATDAGEYSATATLADGYKWADGSMDEKTITWSIAKAANEWITEPMISVESWIEGETAGELTDGIAKFGAVTATINGAAFTALPTAIGSYSIEYTVAETINYSGLTKLVTFEIVEKPNPIPTINPDWGYVVTELGENKNEVAVVFTNHIETAMTWTVPVNLENVQFLVVGGGGGGGSAGTGGGGGAGGGGVVTGMIYKLEMDSIISVSVGAGGAGGTRNSAGGLLASTQGGNSTLTIGSVGAIIAYGGAKVHKDGEYSGGSGNGSYGAGKAGTATKGKVDLSVEELVYSVESFGNNGGYGYNNKIGGGGGGAYPGDEGRGGSATSSVAGKGGAGLVSNITGESISYGSGGGGSTSTVGASGGEGAGNGCSNKSAKANQGGGGGGASKYSSGGKGGSGIVVIRYTIPSYLLPEDAEALPEVTDDSKVAAALEGSADAKLAANIKTAAEYAAFREWALNLEGVTPEEVKASPNAWLSYALNTDKLIIAAPKEGDVVINVFESAATEGAFEFTVKIDGITVGENALGANLRKVFEVEGAETLANGGAGFSTDNVEVNTVTAENGNVKFMVTPKKGSGELGMGNGNWEKPDSFFFRVKMK